MEDKKQIGLSFLTLHSKWESIRAQWSRISRDSEWREDLASDLASDWKVSIDWHFFSLKLNFSNMASSGIATPLVVDDIDRARPNFEKHLYKSIVDDLSNSFWSVPYRVLHVEDIRAYIHCNIEEIGISQMMKLYTQHMIDEMGSLKLEFKSIEEGFCVVHKIFGVRWTWVGLIHSKHNAQWNYVAW